MNLARPLTDKEYAECFDAFKQVSSEWMAMQDWLEKEFLPHLSESESSKALSVLSIGSGTGDFDLALMRILLEKIHQLSYVAVDPNPEHNRIFCQRYMNCGLKLDSFEVIPHPFGQDHLHGGFDLIHLTHCLYYIPDRRDSIARAYRMLNQGGFLLIFHQTTLGINEIQRAYLKLVKGDAKEMFSAHDISVIFDELGLRFNYDVLISDIDVTECIKDTEVGRKILNFFLESDQNGIDPSLKADIIATMKEICRHENGRYYLFHPCGIFWIRKG
ncbi:MAG: class I SAM-dependent methyltransferase [Methanotrichaceae archaeon]|nr:class I SAM-dependent methyltransferase [Methanotrichaceae archaeon]